MKLLDERDWKTKFALGQGDTYTVPKTRAEYTNGECRITVNEEKPTRGVFSVDLRVLAHTTNVVTTGPEPRPFPLLKALEIDEIAESVWERASEELRSLFALKYES